MCVYIGGDHGWQILTWNSRICRHFCVPALRDSAIITMAWNVLSLPPLSFRLFGDNREWDAWALLCPTISHMLLHPNHNGPQTAENRWETLKCSFSWCLPSGFGLPGDHCELGAGRCRVSLIQQALLYPTIPLTASHPVHDCPHRQPETWGEMSEKGLFYCLPSSGSRSFYWDTASRSEISSECSVALRTSFRFGNFGALKRPKFISLRSSYFWIAESSSGAVAC